jgi:hypothetical protein
LFAGEPTLGRVCEYRKAIERKTIEYQAEIDSHVELQKGAIVVSLFHPDFFNFFLS